MHRWNAECLPLNFLLVFIDFVPKHPECIYSKLSIPIEVTRSRMVATSAKYLCHIDDYFGALVL